jgi:hypothetical protein
MKLKYIAILSAFTLAALAQQPTKQITTWKGLQFGMTETEIQKAYPHPLKKEIRECRACADHKETILITDEFELYGEPLFARAVARLDLNDNGQLREVNLWVRDASGEPGDTNGVVIAFTITEDLKDKYGEPVSKKGDGCSQHEAALAETITGKAYCSSRWRSEGQNIDLWWGVKNERLEDGHIIISYTPFDRASKF